MKALGQVTAQRLELLNLPGRFHALGHGPDSHRVGKIDAAAHDRRISRIRLQAHDEGPVDFQLIDGKILQVGEAGVAGAKIVDGEAQPPAS